MTDVLPEIPTVRALLEQAWDCIAPVENWMQGEEYNHSDERQDGKEKACIIGALSVALLGGYGITAAEGYTDFFATINNQMKSRSFTNMMETLPVQAVMALAEALKQEFPNMYSCVSGMVKKTHQGHMRQFERNGQVEAHKNGSLHVNGIPCFLCNGEECDPIGVMVSFNDRELDPQNEIWNRYPLLAQMHHTSLDPAFLEQKSAYTQDIKAAAAKIHSEVIAVFQRAIKNEIQKEEAA